jgi:hypothetical protein
MLSTRYTIANPGHSLPLLANGSHRSALMQPGVAREQHTISWLKKEARRMIVNSKGKST